MPSLKTLSQAFVTGEVTRELFGRIDFDKLRSGLEVCRNFVVLPHGPVENRAGFQFVDATLNHPSVGRLIPFSFSESQTFAIEIANGYFRFYTLGGVLESSPGVPYTISHTYSQSHIPLLKFVQSGDVVTITHPAYPVRELRRLGTLSWSLTAVSFASETTSPTTPSVVATVVTPGTPRAFTYVVTALNSLGFEESLPSPVSGAVNNDLTISGNFNTISWSAVTGASAYNVYKYAAGVYAYIGQTASLSLVDDNITADTSNVIPISGANTFDSAGKYPALSGYFEQRRFFAASDLAPMNLWATQSSSERNLSYAIPSKDSDALRFKIQSSRANRIRHIVTMQDMIALSASTEWRIFSSTNGPLTPSTIMVKAQSQNGASNIDPIVVNSYLLYEQAKGGHIREMSYKWQSSGYESNDISLLAPHLFDKKQVTSMAFSRAPLPILWVTNSDGNLLGLTYVPEQELLAWHSHTTDGFFESCCTVSEGDRDALYVIVRRVIGGVTKRYVEVLHDRYFATQADAFFVDSGLTYSGSPAATITGLDHLEGKVVSVLGDGAVMAQKTVSGGSITLEHAVSKAHVGLPIDAKIKTVPLAFQDNGANGQANIKNVNKVWVQLERSGIFNAGPSDDELTPVKIRTFENMGDPADLYSGQLDLVIKGDWNSTGQVVVKQADPLPLTIVFVAAEVSVGG